MTDNIENKLPLVLVVDDNLQNLELILAYLEDVECETTSATDGYTALDIVNKNLCHTAR